MAQELISALFKRWEGKAGLVIGGGPSANADLPRLALSGFPVGCVLSANHHGQHQSLFKVDATVNMDFAHCQLKRERSDGLAVGIPMEEILAPLKALGAIHINRFSWADYRLGDWTYGGNSGMAAIVVAAALGLNPIIVTGIDMWNGGRLYFHGLAGAVKTKDGAMHRLMKKSLQSMDRECKGANIRPMSGQMTQVFKQWDPNEPQQKYKATPYRHRLSTMRTVHMTVRREFSLRTFDRVPSGTVLALTPKEAEWAGPKLA